ncbi:MAG: hypothetical protein K2L50_04445 [Bacteroidales bacterium]|nr:hypothetical protein [Bacteroidales bacterium]
MKKLIALILFALCIAFSYAQEATEERKVTTFLGIPVDGSKSEMIHKLQKKGYQYDEDLDMLTGEYNGEDVMIGIQTNNNRVWRLGIIDVARRSEGQIKIRFNKLCEQFSNNKRYKNTTDQTISQFEDISYEMAVHNKQYQALFFQDALPELDSVGLYTELRKKYTPEQLDNPTEEQEQKIFDIKMDYINDAFQKISGFINRSVWFTIINEKYGKYYIVMYYENGYNEANGEDL